MENKSFFISHEIDYPFLWGMDLSLPFILKFALNIDGVDISDADRNTLRSLNQERLLYFSNHPSTIEPPVAYYVANVMGSRFYYMASRNVFNWGFGLVGSLIKKVGAFSVLSGGADREAVKMAKSILANKSGKLVIYPEGMCSSENDTLVTFMPGIAQIGFWGLEDAKKTDPDADVKVLPAFVKYILTGTKETLLREIETSLVRLEKHLKIVPGNKNLLRRFLTVGRVLMEEAEREYQITYDGEKDYQFRVGAIRHAALNRAGDKLGIPFHKEEDAIQKIREVFTVLDGITSGLGKEKISISKSDLAMVQKDVDRAYLFLVIKPESLFAYPSAERFIEWIYRFENLIFGKTNPRPRRARVIFAKPFGLSEYYQFYKENKKKTVEEVTTRLRNEIEHLLKEAVGFSRPIVEPFDVGEDLKI
ncbi:1-acyl-sn-glycerol-3-phosphate acyltransferase [Leptospira ognonensis]|uniref:1-acyl-sn-glycerol-3-phosphate acyltransferase n=1 Tax=Leptospira ognonensis TaxID=2484945 RepID=A0A4R9JW10_9LEPT|nr:1-acyl-sn-glycerol-3-phosphate acyltransferase [Leptospira ognonensis]TGL57170.1 1-acyl-sn-glycerol-3-phosphate acyltransferase [Leptospira ognonensis]